MICDGAWIALLRGVGGGIRPLSMRDLIDALEGIGLEGRPHLHPERQCHLQQRQGSRRRLAGEIERCIEKKFGFHSKTFVLSVPELQRAAAGNPFPQADENRRRCTCSSSRSPPRRHSSTR